MFKRLSLLSKVIFLFLWLSPLTAYSFESWVKTGGPLGGLGYDVRIDPANKNIMFVTDNYSGVNKSTNAGATWFKSNSGIDTKDGSTKDSVPIFSLTIDPNNSNRIWAGTFVAGVNFGVFRTDDGGTTWARRVNGISLEGDEDELVFRGFTIQQGNSNIVYVMAEVTTSIQGREFRRVKGRIYKTTDGGENWTKIWQGDNLARYLIINPDNSNILYASTGIFDREGYNSDCANGVSGGVGVLKSTDGGSTWSQINNGLTDLYVGSLRMHPSNPGILFAATGNGACSGLYDNNIVSGLFKTTDSGNTWTKVIGNDIMTTVNFSPSNHNIIYAGSAVAFYRSEDGGNTWGSYQMSEEVWGPAGIRAGFPIDAVVDPDNPLTLYTNNYGGGVFKSTDGAQTWLSWSKGYTGAEIHDVEISRGNSSLVYAIGRSGPFKSNNSGEDWIGIANGSAAGFAEWYSIKQKYGNANIILIADEHQGGILRSTDGGNDFAEVLRHPFADASNPNKRQGFKALSFSPSNPQIVYAGLAKDRSKIDSSPPLGIAIYKSIDSGATWSAKASIIDGKNINAIIIHSTNPDVVYAATTSGVFKTTNGADTWTQLSSLGNRDIRSFAIDFSDPQIIYAGEENGGVWKTTDGGTTWAGPKNTGFSSGNPSIRGIVIDPNNTSIIYAGDWTSGVCKSVNGGETWSPFPDSAMSGLSTRAIKDLAISFDGTVLYASTQGEGVFRNSLSKDTASPTISSTSPDNNAKDIANNTSITATFSEAMDSSTINTSSFTLNGSAISGTVSYDSATMTAAFTPSADLASNITYTAAITTGVKDSAGNNMASNYTWSFTTKTSSSSGGGGGGGCFIATAVFGSYSDPHVQVLIDFRNKYLLTNPPGKAFVNLYYKVSPHLTDYIRGHEILRYVLRQILTSTTYGIKYPKRALLISLFTIITVITLRIRKSKRL